MDISHKQMVRGYVAAVGPKGAAMFLTVVGLYLTLAEIPGVPHWIQSICLVVVLLVVPYFLWRQMRIRLAGVEEVVRKLRMDKPAIQASIRDMLVSLRHAEALYKNYAEAKTAENRRGLVELADQAMKSVYLEMSKEFSLEEANNTIGPQYVEPSPVRGSALDTEKYAFFSMRRAKRAGDYLQGFEQKSRD